MITKSEYAIIIIISPQGKFIRVHFGPQGKIAGADIEYCKLILFDSHMPRFEHVNVTTITGHLIARAQLRMRSIARVNMSYDCGDLPQKA